MLIRNAEIAGRAGLDLRIAGARIAALGPALARAPGEPVHEARGGALLPGLHDHHLHLHATAAAARSIVCGPPEVSDAAELEARLRRAAGRGEGWLRGVGYHESVAGPLDRERLDAWVATRPLRVQHRSGALWLLNSAALAALDAEGPDAPAGLERVAGRASGRLFRGDAWLGRRLRNEAPDLAPVGARLAAAGVTGATDTSATNDARALEHLARAVASGALPQRLEVMGGADLPQPPREVADRMTRGAVKILLDEARLPDFEALCERIRAAHAAGRAVAVHCVTRSELVFVLGALREAGARRGDRLEHASVAPPELVAGVAALSLRVVTQPHFIAERGDRYREDVAPEDLPWLYRARGWLEAGVPLAAGSDAPYGAPDPWASMAAAVRRETALGRALGAEEALSPEGALALFTSPAAAPGDPPRRLEVGAAADLCLLDRPWSSARERLCREDVAATWCGGRRVFERP